MNTQWLAPLLILCGSIFYHVIQKNLGQSTRPMAVMAAAYFAATVITTIISVFFERGPWVPNMKDTGNLLLLGLGMVGIEFGYFLCYRANWQIGVVSSVMTPMCNFVLVVGALLFFDAKISAKMMLGAAISGFGVYLLNS